MSEHNPGPGVVSLCTICGCTIDLDHSMRPYDGGYAHIGCHAFYRYHELVDVAWELLQALDEDEEEVEIDWSAMKETLRDALMAIDKK